MAIAVKVPYQANAKQTVFHTADEDEVIYGGAKGGGKSCALMMETLAYGLEHPGANMYLFRETYDDLEANLIREMKEKWPKPLYKYNESKHIATLINGTRVNFRYIQNLQDAEGYQGRSMDFIGVDELTKHEEMSIQILLSCLRSPKGYPPRFRATCNPGGRGHGWVKANYIDSTDYGKNVLIHPITEGTIRFIPATVYDNDVLMQNDPAYVKRLENLPEDEKKAFLYGDWDIFKGQYFKFKRSQHVIEPFEIPRYWKRYRSIDWGYNDHCAVFWHSVDSEGRTYTYRELYVREMDAEDVAAEIKRLSYCSDEIGRTVPEKIEYTVASPDMWQTRGGGMKGKDGEVKGKNIADIFNENKVYLIKADTSRVIGWQRMNLELKEQPDGKPNWRIFENCENLIRTIPVMVRDDKKIEDLADRQEDHAVESVRYFFMSRPQNSRSVEEEESRIAKHKQMLIRRITQRRQKIM